jgi:hypothetical protein
MGKEKSLTGLTIRDVKIIFDIPGTEILDEDDVERLVELPLVNAAKILFHKNIKTYWSTANTKNPFAAICIEPRYLSTENIATAKTYLGFKGDEEENVFLQCPVAPGTSLIEVDRYFVDLANRFADQTKPE